MYPNRLMHRVIVCLAGAVALVAVGGRIFAADTPAKESAVEAKPAADKKKAAPSIQLTPSTTTQPTPGEKFTVAVAQGRALFERYNRRDEFMNLQKQGQAAQQSGDQQKMGELRAQMQKLSGEFRKSFSDALAAVAKRENYDIIAGEILYKSETTNLADVTDAVVEQLNSTTTAPAADSAETKPADEDVADKPVEKKPAGEK